MPARKPGRAHGLERTDNDMGQTSWPQISMVNQKNYYTEYLKRDDQLLAMRPNKTDEERRFSNLVKQARDRDREQVPPSLRPETGDETGDGKEQAAAEEDAKLEEDARQFDSRTIIIHPGSQNLRIGLATDILPKTVPMVIARKADKAECEDDGGEPRPKRRKVEADVGKIFDEQFVSQYAAMTASIRERAKRAMVRSVPNAREQAIVYNKRTPSEEISEHNDSIQIDWTEIPPDYAAASAYITGAAATRIPDLSRPRYKISRPIRYGTLNEADYTSKNQLLQDFTTIIEDAIVQQLKIPKKHWGEYSCVFVIPDLYERNHVTTFLDVLFREFGFVRVSFIQESLAASFGAGFSTCVVVDVGAQKTSICCVDEGICIEGSRVLLRYGGDDVTETFLKMMLLDGFPYADINLKRRYDYILAEELKRNFCTLSISTLTSVSKAHEFDLRAPGQRTRHYFFKTYDEVMLAPLGYIYPAVFYNTEKLKGRHSLLGRSHDLYDGSPNDPLSTAQNQVLQAASADGEGALTGDANGIANAAADGTTAAPAVKAQVASAIPKSIDKADEQKEGTPLEADGEMDADGEGLNVSDKVNPIDELIKAADARDSTLPIMPLVDAINLSITEGAKGDDRKTRDFYGGIMTVGGGSLTANFHQFLEQELLASQPRLKKELLVNLPPREIDPQVLCWKGASVFGKLSTNDAWVTRLEHNLLNSRILTYKCIFNW